MYTVLTFLFGWLPTVLQVVVIGAIGIFLLFIIIKLVAYVVSVIK